MYLEEQDRRGGSDEGRRFVTSRRAALGSSGVFFLSLLASPSLGQGQSSGPEDPNAATQARREQRRAFAERMRIAGNPEDRARMVENLRELDRRKAIDEFKTRLGLSDPEWTAVKPHVEKVYDLVHSQAATRTGVNRMNAEVELRSRELRETIDNKDAETSQIQARLTALRAAREKIAGELAEARKNLRQLMTLRQEAVLVLGGLLD